MSEFPGGQDASCGLAFRCLGHPNGR
jgi:hypothetical protein